MAGRLDVWTTHITGKIGNGSGGWGGGASE